MFGHDTNILQFCTVLYTVLAVTWHTLPVVAYNIDCNRVEILDS
jgi:hypothetical protein